VVEYTYGAWGDILSVTGSMADTIGQKNPLRYRGYYYDAEIGFYYVSSRYYDPEIGRFVNADGYVSTGQDINGFNMFTYCGNNPINRIDPTGTFWKEIGTFFSNAWKNVKKWAKNAFGGEVTTVTTVDYSEKIIPEPWPIVVETGTSETTTVTQKGDSSKPISVYAQGNLTNPIQLSSAGLKLNASKFTHERSIGADNIGVSNSWTKGNQTNSFGIKANLWEFKIGFEYSTAIQWDNTTQTNYTNISVSGWWILAACATVTSGQILLQPAGAH